jgi:hypothetical protein
MMKNPISLFTFFLAPMLATCLPGQAAAHSTKHMAIAKPPHHCAADAMDRAYKLLKFHSNNDDRAEIDKRLGAKFFKTIPALVGKAKYDILFVQGYVYKGVYDIHLTYAKIPNECVLMGEEILERADVN